MGPELRRSFGRALPTIRVGDVEPLADPSAHWLIEELWSARALGVLGGPPKSTKTWLAVDLAISVASGTKALGRFAVKDPGPVLFFAAEDAPKLIRERFQGLALQRNLSLDAVDVRLLDVPVLKLDSKEDRARLSETVRTIRPRLLVLDPLVRMHSLDENSATEISELLSFLRALEREEAVAILLVHHTRKNISGSLQPGVTLRGSSDLHAVGDSNLYLRRQRENLLLTIEHRSAPSPEPITLSLVTKPAPHLEVVGEDLEAEERVDDTLPEEVLSELQHAPAPLRVEDLRARLRVRKQRVVEALRALTDRGFVRRSGDGFLAVGEFPGE